MIEYKATFKKLFAEEYLRTPTQQEIEESVKVLEDFLSEMGIELYNADDVATESPLRLFWRSEERINQATPTLGTWDKSWKMIGGGDSITIILAEKIDARILATFDQGFKAMNHPNIKPLIVSEEY